MYSVKWVWIVRTVAQLIELFYLIVTKSTHLPARIVSMNQTYKAADWLSESVTGQDRVKQEILNK